MGICKWACKDEKIRDEWEGMRMLERGRRDWLSRIEWSEWLELYEYDGRKGR